MQRQRILGRVHLALILAGVWTWSAASAQARWEPLAGGDGASRPHISVVAQTATAVTVEVTVPGVELRDAGSGSARYVEALVPGCAPLQVAEHPEVPLLPVSLAIAGQGHVALEVIEVETRVLTTAPILPSLGQVPRDIDPSSLTRREGDVYRDGGIWPLAAATLGQPYIVRDARGVTVQVAPVRWDAVHGQIIAMRRIVLRVTTRGVDGVNALPAAKAASDGFFRSVTSRLFANASVTARDDGKAQGDPDPTASARMIVVCGDALASATQPFVTWKRQRGMDVQLVRMSDIGGTAGDLYYAVNHWFTEPAGLGYLVLVGDVEQVPTQTGTIQGADGDQIYALQAGSDLFPDFLVSRISARNATEVQVQVAKIVAYERDPEIGGDWYGRAVGIASDEGTPADYERADLLRDDLLGYGYSDVSRIYQSFGGTTAQITADVNAGVGVINYIGHGAAAGWLSVPFGASQVHALDNVGKLPWIIDVSCTTGDFSLPECFAEAWMRSGTPSAPTGAVGIVAASASAPWVPPCVMQSAMIDRLTSSASTAGESMELGALFAVGLAKVLTVYDGLTVAQQMVEEYNLLGDCSLQLRTRAPQTLAVDRPATLLPGATALSVRVVGTLSTTVTLTSGAELLGVAATGTDGRATLTLSRAILEDETTTLTVTGAECAPYLATLPTATQTVPVDDLSPAVSRIVGNYPNPCNPHTTVAFATAGVGQVDLRIYDLHGRLVSELVHETLPAGDHEVAWNGADTTGRLVASGSYLARLVAGGETSVRSLMLVR